MTYVLTFLHPDLCSWDTPVITGQQKNALGQACSTYRVVGTYFCQYLVCMCAP